MDSVKPRGTSYFRLFNMQIVEEFHASGGNVGGQFEDMDLLLLTTTGAKSGLPREVPLVYFTIDQKLLVAGSFDGNDVDPGWVHNLRVMPRARINVGMDTYDVIARELPRWERDESYPKIVDIEPVFGDFEARTQRVIPVFELRRI
jgi:deazaflavin-dependent oxidoreductase (nitroreductase family)